ncbi:integrase/recombinase xerD homolog [Procambarus clarkii]|uniref:integrase/recombinase xerD homolog n=1 Tax=Procambarus clarkii TaxID=6728 RepID=UPI0037433F95
MAGGETPHHFQCVQMLLPRDAAALVPARSRPRRDADNSSCAPPALQLHPATVRTLFNSLQPATRRAYRAKWVEYAAYVSAGRRGECPFDAAPSTLGNFLQSLLSRGLAYRSLHAYLAAIAFVCKLHGRRDPTRQFLVTQLLKGARNSAQRAAARRLPVTRSLLHRLLRALGGVCNSAYEKSCYRALFSLAFHACLRPGEAVYVDHGRHTLNLEQVSLTSAGIDIVFNTYKHSAGRTPTLSLRANPSSKYCPVRALSKYFNYRGLGPGPIFKHAAGAPVTRRDFSKILRSALTPLGLPPDDYAPHSFHIGRATQLSRDGLATSEIMAVGRWRSSAFTSYVRRDVVALPL